MNTLQKLRGPKIFGMAIFDWVATIVATVLFAYFTYRKPNPLEYWQYFLLVFVAVIAVALVAHNISGTPTQFGYYLGLNQKVR